MNILEYTNNLINEGYIFSDKTISIDLDKFESGSMNKLFIVGLSGSGKSTLGVILAKKYNTKRYALDLCWDPKMKNSNDDTDDGYWHCVLDKITSPDTKLVEGLAIVNLFSDNPPIPKEMLFKIHQYILKQPVIILGTSAILSTLRATHRATSANNKYEGGYISTLISRGKINFKLAEKHLSTFRKARIKAGGNVQEFKVPRL